MATPTKAPNFNNSDPLGAWISIGSYGSGPKIIATAGQNFVKRVQNKLEGWRKGTPVRDSYDITQDGDYPPAPPNLPRVGADGVFGPNTAKVLAEWAKAKNPTGNWHTRINSEAEAGRVGEASMTVAAMIAYVQDAKYTNLVNKVMIGDGGESYTPIQWLKAAPNPPAGNAMRFYAWNPSQPVPTPVTGSTGTGGGGSGGGSGGQGGAGGAGGAGGTGGTGTPGTPGTPLVLEKTEGGMSPLLIGALAVGAVAAVAIATSGSKSGRKAAPPPRALPPPKPTTKVVKQKRVIVVEKPRPSSSVRAPRAPSLSAKKR